MAEMHDFVQLTICKQPKIQKSSYDKHGRNGTFTVGQPIWLSQIQMLASLIHDGTMGRKLGNQSSQWSTPYGIDRQESNKSCSCQSPEDTNSTRTT